MSEEEMDEFEGDDFGFEESSPKRERPKPKFTDVKPARRRIVVDWLYRVQKMRIAMSNGIKGLERDYADIYLKEQADLDRQTYLSPIEKIEVFFVDACREVAKDLPIANWLVDNVKGMGWNLTAQLTGIIGDISFFPTISKLWAYAGLRPDSARRSGEKLGHNPILKRLLYNIVTSFIKARGYYADLYSSFKMEESTKAIRFMRLLKERLALSSAFSALNVLEAEERTIAEVVASDKPASYVKFCNAIYNCAIALGFRSEEKQPQFVRFNASVRYLAQKLELSGVPALTPMHRHRRAMRKVQKIFLQHVWLKWREIEGLPVSDPWIFAIGGHDVSHYIPPPKDRSQRFVSLGASASS